jgi:hypothetical protein
MLWTYPSGFGNDLRRGLPALTKKPGFLLTLLLAIVFGVSATTTVFSLIHAVLIRSLPYGEPERLVYMWTPLADAPGFGKGISPAFEDMTVGRR